MPLSPVMSIDRLRRSFFLALALLLGGVPPAVQAAEPPACLQAVQLKADQALTALDQRQAGEDEQLRRHPTASYATMNGPVLRELEKRQQRERLVQALQDQASKTHHCQLKGPEFN